MKVRRVVLLLELESNAPLRRLTKRPWQVQIPGYYTVVVQAQANVIRPTKTLPIGARPGLAKLEKRLGKKIGVPVKARKKA